MVVTHCGMRPLDCASGSQRPSERSEAASSWRSGRIDPSSCRTSVTRSAAQPPTNPLSPRQQQVLAAYAAGETTGRIAKTLHTSNATVYVHLHDALARLGATSKIEAIDIARKNGWIHIEQ